jgi:CTP synthase (UTP-ammonia lyase)
MTAVTIAIVGERIAGFPPHVATDAAIAHSAQALGVAVEARWVATDEPLPPADAIWCAPGSPYRSLDGALAALRHGREQGIPTLGTCGGCQHMLLEFARNVLGLTDAQHAEYDPYASRLFVTPLTCEVAGRTMHVTLDPGSRLYGGATEVQEQYYCNFGLNPDYREQLNAAGLRITGVDADGDARVFELDDHPFYVATLFVPQMRSQPSRPHPVVSALVGAAAASMVA